MRALVTGATGFVGSALCRRLKANGHEVTAFVRSPGKLAERGIAVDHMVEGEITDRKAVEQAVRGAEVVFGVAATFREPQLSDERYRAVNVGGTRNLLEAARRHGARRVVHCSTVGIHGNVSGPPIDEEAPLRPDGIYEATKAEADQLARRYAQEHGLDVVVLRPTPIYGPGDTRLLKLFKLAGKRRLLMLGKGSARYHLVHVDDLAQAFLLAASRQGIAGQAFIVGGDEKPTLLELIHELGVALGVNQQQVFRLPALPVRLLAHGCELVARPLGISPPIYRRRVDFFTNNRDYDISKARRMLAFRPRVALRDGIRETAAWYERQGLLRRSPEARAAAAAWFGFLAGLPIA